MAPSHLSVREMREDEKPLVLEMLKAGVKDTENRVALHALTRPPALLLLAAASSGLRFVLASFALALLLPVFLAVAAVKLGLRARWGSLPPPGGLGGPWVAVRGSGDVGPLEVNLSNPYLSSVCTEKPPWVMSAVCAVRAPGWESYLGGGEEAKQNTPQS
ncbi:NAT14 isoform 4 [Pongo abelii]|uniref:NAT14 isoform 4 n=1 Tax=Pongo abelii TaxID=9601 RepID=A0A2J8R3H8_PONAB|nr:NAT14 isoform 4 [Pongo abelii]